MPVVEAMVYPPARNNQQYVAYNIHGLKHFEQPLSTFLLFRHAESISLTLSPNHHHPQKKTKVEEEEDDVNPSTVQYYTGFTSIGGDPNLLVLNSTAIPSSYNNNYHSNKPHTILHLGKGGTLIQPDQHQQPQRMPPLFMQQQMSLGSFPGSGLSPGFQEEGGSYFYYGYPGYAASTALHQNHPASMTSNNNGGGGGSNFTPDYNDAGGNGIAEGDHQQQHQQHQFEQIRPMGMTPLVFTGLPANFQLTSLHSVGGGLSGGGVGGGGGGFYEYNASANAYHPGLLQVLSTEDGTMIDGGGGGGGTIASNGTTVPYHHFRMVPMPAMGNAVAPLQQPKKWVRWSEDEDRILGQAVEQYGENNFRQISEQVFQGTRTEQQCKNRWKKVSVYRTWDSSNCLSPSPCLLSFYSHGLSGTPARTCQRSMDKGGG